MKLTISLDEVFTSADWEQTVAEILKEEIRAAIKKEIKVQVAETVKKRRDEISAGVKKKAKLMIEAL